jgi:hypothetical protein
MAGNIATLVPITKGDPRAGRRKGQVNLTTKTLKHAILLAGAQSEHSKDQTLLSYVVWLANERPELYISLLVRLVPQQARIKVEDNVRVEPLNPNMSLPEMVTAFEMKIKSDYRPPPRTIEHHDDDDDDDETES